MHFGFKNARSDYLIDDFITGQRIYSNALECETKRLRVHQYQDYSYHQNTNGTYMHQINIKHRRRKKF